MDFASRNPTFLDPNRPSSDGNPQASVGMATECLFNGSRKNPWQDLLAVASLLSCSFPTVLALGRDSRESPPKPSVMPSRALLLANETLNLTCLSHENSTCIQWLKDDHYLQPSHQLLLSDGNRTLILTGVTRADAGAYRCEVRNLVNFSRSGMTVVSVAYGPDAVEISPSGNVTQFFSSPLNLTCSADSVPAPLYSWVFNNTRMDQNGSFLAINSTGWEHEGTYECWAHNALTNLTGWASVTVSVVIVTDEESAPSEPALIPRIISGTVVGMLAGVVLIVIPVYCFCACVRSRKNPPAVPTVSRCDNHPAGTQAKPGPKLEDTPDPSSTYQELQPGDGALYEELGR